jgi:DNA (cytosine-5)-methyltransferase 1
MMTKKGVDLTVCELFAGVGGFHLGLSKCGWDIIWADQWEPGKKRQYAYDCYQRHFPGVCINEDIGKVEVMDIPDHSLLVGGFPCQDYSVATTNAHGIEGRKGVLWWEIFRILKGKMEAGSPVRFVLLENVDRLLKSPSKQRGRDFGIILSCLNQLGYVVEWRMVNAADYGFPQKRRRTFIFGTLVKEVSDELYKGKTGERIATQSGFFASCLPARLSPSSLIASCDVSDDLVEMSNEFRFDFENAGSMRNGRVSTIRINPDYRGERRTLGDVLEEDVGKEYFIPEEEVGSDGDPPEVYRRSWRYCKGAKSEPRRTREGYDYNYTEGAIPFPDRLDEPSRTMLTSEANRRPNRISHVVLDPRAGRYRLITPIEAERLNGFEDGWTEGMPLSWRYFCMGNALVVGLVELMGARISDIVVKHRPSVTVMKPRKAQRQRIDEY